MYLIAGDLRFKNIFYFDFRVLEGEEETAFLDAVKDVREVKKKYEVKRKVLKTKRHPADGIDKSKDDEIAKLKAELLAGSKKPEEEPVQQETKPRKKENCKKRVDVGPEVEKKRNVSEYMVPMER